MTAHEADAEAKRRWGQFGAAWHPGYTRPGEYRFCAVGKMVNQHECEQTSFVQEEWFVFGRGETWEKAFADATARGS